MGAAWNNAVNRGPWLEETADLLRRHERHLEIGLHGVGHEYWVLRRLQRSEFHDAAGIMRPPGVIRRHLEAFGQLLEQNGLGPFPQSFVPPALPHSFGTGEASMQAILSEFGIRYLCTIFSRARQYAPPLQEGLTWESGVQLIGRNEGVGRWDHNGATPPLSINGPVLSLHWANLLHQDSERNGEVSAAWGDYLVARARGFDVFLAPDTAACWTQYCYYRLAALRTQGPGVEIDCRRLPALAALSGPVYLKVRERKNRRWQAQGGQLVLVTHQR